MPSLPALLLAALVPSQKEPALQEPGTAPQPGAAAAASTAAARAPRALVLRGATVHTLVPGAEPAVADVWIEDGRIRAVGAEAASASDPLVVDLAGKHVVPGLVDALVNFDPEHDPLYVAAGVTLVRDVGGDRGVLHQERAPDRRDRSPGPALLSALAALDGDPPGAATAVVLRTADSAERYLPILFEDNVDFLSILPGLPRDAWRKTIELAHERGLTVVGPRPPAMTLAAAVAGGQDAFIGLDALLPPGVGWDAVTDEALAGAVAELARSGKALVPLLHASALRLEDQAESPLRRLAEGLLSPAYESWWRAELAQRTDLLTDERRAAGHVVVARQGAALRALHEAGARLVPGSGAPQPWLFPGTALHQELSAWEQAGIPADAVLAYATRGAADAVGQAAERGVIAAGAVADLLVLAADPRADLGALLEPERVCVRGNLLDRAALDARVTALATRQAELRTELAAMPELAAPPQGEGGVVILEGTVESTSFGMRVSVERYRVVRIDDETLLYTTRVQYPPSAGSAGRELTLEQFVRRGLLEQVHAALTEGSQLLEHDALWTANSWRMQTRLDGKVISTPAPLRERPALVDASSALSFLVLGQHGPAERIPVAQMHPAFDCEPVNWRMERDAEGIHRIRTQIGYKAFRLDAVGAVEFGLSKVGGSVVETRAVSGNAFGGAGLPLPPAPAPATAPAGEPAPGGGG